MINDNGKLIEVKASLPGIRFGKAAWGDFTNDGIPYPPGCEDVPDDKT